MSTPHQLGLLADIKSWSDRSLLIPEGLAAYADARLLMQHGQQSIYHK